MCIRDRVETTFSGKNKILVSVKDHGAGISEEDQKYIFDRFYKADATRNEAVSYTHLGFFRFCFGGNVTFL